MADVTAPPPGSEVAFETASAALREQFQRIDALDSKAGILLASGGVFAGFLFGVESLMRQAPRPIAIISTVLLIVSLATALLAFATRAYSSAPTPEVVVRIKLPGQVGSLESPRKHAGCGCRQSCEA